MCVCRVCVYLNCLYVCVYMHIHVSIIECLYICTRTCMHTHTLTLSHIHIHFHTPIYLQCWGARCRSLFKYVHRTGGTSLSLFLSLSRSLSLSLSLYLYLALPRSLSLSLSLFLSLFLSPFHCRSLSQS